MSENAMQHTSGNGRSLMTKFAHQYGVEPQKMQKTLIDTAFRQKDGQITNEQMMALLIVADQYKLNPFTKEIYAFPDKNQGIVPIVGIDGWSRIINQHPDFDGMEFEAAPDEAQIDEHHKPCPAWITCTIYRKDRNHPIAVTEYLDEVYRPPFKKNGNVFPGPWQSHTKRFLRHKAMIQCARLAFGFTGIYDQDEGERVIEGQVIRNEAEAEPEADMPRSRSEQAEPVAQEDDRPAQEGQLRVLRTKIEQVGATEADVCSEFGIDGLQELTTTQVNDVLDWLKALDEATDA